MLREGFDKIAKKDTDHYFVHMEDVTIKNDKFREVLYTTPQLQLVLMSLKPNEDVGEETHKYVTQFIRFEKGEGRVIMNDSEFDITDGDAIIVPAGTKHNITNIGKDTLKFYTIYSPPNHPEDTDEPKKSDEKDEAPLTQED